jgi:ribosomal protein L11 methyltransferase
VVDIDPQALLATRDNASFNGIDPARLQVQASSSFVAREGGYDVVIANILLDPLITLAPVIFRQVAPGGVLVLSGVLASQRHDLLAAYPGIRFEQIVEEDGWLRLAGRHRG